MSADRDICDWPIVRDRYHSPLAALAREYPNIVKTDPLIAAACAQIRIAELAINARMDELAGEHG